MFWHGAMGLVCAMIAIPVEYAVRDIGQGEGLHLFNMGSKVFLILLAATLFDTLRLNCATIAF